MYETLSRLDAANAEQDIPYDLLEGLQAAGSLLTYFIDSKIILSSKVDIEKTISTGEETFMKIKSLVGKAKNNTQDLISIARGTDFYMPHSKKKKVSKQQRVKEHILNLTMSD